jgi:hypothetical protein
MKQLKNFIRLVLSETLHSEENNPEESYAKDISELLRGQFIDIIVSCAEFIEKNDLLSFVTRENVEKFSGSEVVKSILETLGRANLRIDWFSHNIERPIILYSNRNDGFNPDTWVEGAKEAERVLQELDAKIKSDSESDAPAEAPPEAPLGKFAFAPLRPSVPFERNTSVENKLQDAIIAHLEENNKLPPDALMLIRTFTENNWYPNLFSEPKEEMLYRGMFVSKEYLKSMLGTKRVPKSGKKKINWPFRPWGKASSWTSDKAYARDIVIENVYENAAEGEFVIVMCAKSSDNRGKLFDIEGVYEIPDLESYSHEKEIIGYGDITIESVEWEKLTDDYDY